jgi:hypothetical protein
MDRTWGLPTFWRENQNVTSSSHDTSKLNDNDGFLISLFSDSPRLERMQTQEEIVCAAPGHAQPQLQPRQREGVCGRCCRGCCALIVDIFCIIIFLIPALILCFFLGWIFVIGFFLIFIAYMIIWPFAICCDCETAPPTMHEHSWVIVRPAQTVWRWQQDTHQWVMNEPRAAPSPRPHYAHHASASTSKDTQIDLQSGA